MNTASSNARRYAQFLLVALLAALMALPVAHAQRNKRSERSVEKEAMFPSATREEPDLSGSRRVGPKLEKLQDAFHDDKFAEAQQIADEILNHSAANEYDKSFASQVLAHVAIANDDYPKAIGLLRQSIAFGGLPNDQHYQMMYQVSQMQLAEEDYQGALQTLQQFMQETRTEDARYLAMQGNAYYRLEQYEPAVDALTRAIESTDAPEESWLQLLMATYFEMDKPAEAAQVAEQLVARNPDDKTLIRNLSSIYLQADDNVKAARVMEDAKARGLLNEAQDYEQLYKLYYYIDEEDKAVATINEGLDKGILQPTAEVYRIVGDAYYFSERIPQALEAYTKGAEHAEDGEMDFLRGRLLHELDRYAEAKAAANRALERGVKRPGDAYLVLGAAELGLDNKSAAVAAYRKAAQHPESKTIAETWLRQSGSL